MKTGIRVGVTGLGMGYGHVKQLVANQNAEVVALCDKDEARLEQVASECNIPNIYSDFGKMLRSGGLDAVVIATPNKFHAPYTIAALKAGLHVFCEKPMAMNTREAEKMVAASAKAKKNLMINFSYRFSDMSYALKQQVDAGVVGNIYFGRTIWHRRRGMPRFGGWFGSKELAGGGPLIDLGVHRLDLALWLMGYPDPECVSGSVYNKIAGPEARKTGKKFDVEDLACGFVRFRNGASLVIEASWAAHIREDELMITSLCGDKGGLVQRNLNGTYQFEAEVYTEEGGNLFTKKLDRAVVNAPGPQAEFIDSILEKRPPMATGEQGVKVMKILDGIYKSAVTGREVRYPGK